MAHAATMKLLTVLTLLAVLLVACDSDEDGTPTATSADASPTFAWTRTPTPVATEPTLWPSQPAGTPMPTPEPLHPPLEIGDPVPFPDDVVLFLWSGCTNCDGPHSALKRVRVEGGAITSTVVREVPPGGALMWAQVGADGALYVAECSADTCVDPLEERDERPADIYRSMDDGDTWAPFQGETGAVGVADGWSLSPRLVPLEDAEDGRFEIGDVAVDLPALDPRGRFADGYPPYGVLGAVGPAPDGGLLLRWYVRVTEGHSPVSYLTWFDAVGSPRWTASGWFDGVPIEDGVLIATKAYQPAEIPDLFGGPFAAWLPSIVDLRSGTIRPIADPFMDDPHDRNAVIGLRHLD